MEIKQYLEKVFINDIDKDNVFLYNGSQLKALAFRQGCKCDCISNIKETAKKWGFIYDYDFDAYILKNKIDTNYRFQKNTFISSLIEWKLTKK